MPSIILRALYTHFSQFDPGHTLELAQRILKIRISGPTLDNKICLRQGLSKGIFKPPLINEMCSQV